MYNGNYEVASLVYIYIMYMYVQKRYFPLWEYTDGRKANCLFENIYMKRYFEIFVTNDFLVYSGGQLLQTFL